MPLHILVNKNEAIILKDSRLFEAQDLWEGLVLAQLLKVSSLKPIEALMLPL